METKDIRLQNFLQLAKGYGKAHEFCSAIEISPSYYSQVKAKAKAIGDSIARRIEEKLSLPRGYMDMVHSQDTGERDDVPSRALGLAYTINSLPPRIQRKLSDLIYEVALELSSTGASGRRDEDAPTLKPFTGSVEDVQEGYSVSEKARQR